MTPKPWAEREAEIRERLRNITPGDWGTFGLSDDWGFTEKTCRYGFDISTANEDGSPAVGVTEGDDGGGAFIRDADAIFCAHAPTDISDLLAEIDRLRGALKPFANYACDPDEAHLCVAEGGPCHNCIARQALEGR